MKYPKVWLILGAGEGLGCAAVKYLRTHKQVVLMDTKLSPGPLDFIINNSNYGLFSESKPDTDNSVAATINLLRTFVPYLKPGGMIINVPPQLCLATLEDPSKGPELLQALDLFLTTLRQNLETLDCSFHFLKPGERFIQL
jgi:hypothetical protein